MNLERIKIRFMRLPLFSKLLAVGSFLAVISVAMPWYEDLDAFKTGDMFLGITGPLYLAGYVILLASALSLGLVVFNILEKKPPRLPMKENHVHIAAGVLNIFLLILVNSVYFHDKFGVNIALKDARFGMTIAFIGSVVLLVSSIMLEKKKSVALEFDEGRLEPLIELHDHREARTLEEKQHNGAQNENHQAVRTGIRDTLHNQKPANTSTQPWRMDL